MKRFLPSVGLSILGIIFFVNNAFAIPTFARKYRTSCNTCHVAVPKLTAFGESYRLNGYQIPEGDAAYVKEEPVSMGAPAWKKVWPDAVWPGEIPGPVPLSVRILSDFKVNEAAKTASTEFDFPHEVEVMMAGLLGENVPFFAEIEFEGGETSTEAWLGFYDLLNNTLPQRSLNLKIGNLSWNPLAMANEHLRIGKNHYLYGDWKMPSSDNTFRLRDSRPGLELNGIVASRLYYSAGLLQGDDSHDKDPFFTLRYKWGGTAFDKSAPGDTGTEEAITGKSSGFWVDDALELALFGYFGETRITENANDEFQRLGVGLRKTYNNMDLSTGFIWGTNDDPYGIKSTQSIDSQSFFMEANYVFFPWLIGELRFELLDVEWPSDYITKTGGTVLSDIDQSRWVPGLIFQIRPNIKLVAEGLIYDNYGAGDKPDNFAVRLDVSY